MSTKWKQLIYWIIIFLSFVFALKLVFSALSALVVPFSLVEAKTVPTHAGAPKKGYSVVYKHLKVIQKLIDCESKGKNVKVIDSNGLYSYGILQFQSSTWNGWSKQSGIKGSPMNERDAKRMADWAIENGLVGNWTCAYLEGLI